MQVIKVPASANIYRRQDLGRLTHGFATDAPLVIVTLTVRTLGPSGPLDDLAQGLQISVIVELRSGRGPLVVDVVTNNLSQRERRDTLTPCRGRPTGCPSLSGCNTWLRECHVPPVI